MNFFTKSLASLSLAASFVIVSAPLCAQENTNEEKSYVYSEKDANSVKQQLAGKNITVDIDDLANSSFTLFRIIMDVKDSVDGKKRSMDFRLVYRAGADDLVSVVPFIPRDSSRSFDIGSKQVDLVYDADVYGDQGFAKITIDTSDMGAGENDKLVIKKLEYTSIKKQKVLVKCSADLDVPVEKK